MAFITVDQEPKVFGRTARKTAATTRPRESTIRQALELELRMLGRQVDRFGEIEAAIRLRALSEVEIALSTDALCELAARSARA